MSRAEAAELNRIGSRRRKAPATPSLKMRKRGGAPSLERPSSGGSSVDTRSNLPGMPSAHSGVLRCRAV